MFSRSTEHIGSNLSKYFYPVSIGSVLVVLVTVWMYLPTEFAVFGLYGLFGLVGGAVMYYYSNSVTDFPLVSIDERLHRVGVYSISAVTVGTVALTGASTGLLFGLVVGYLLVVRQLFSDPQPERILPQLIVLFLLSPITKLLTAGQYIGDGDILIHTRLVEDLLVGNTLSAISYASYYEFPGLHILATTVGSIAGLGPYDGLLLTGIAAYVVLIPAVYLLTLRFTSNPPLALATAFAITLLDGFSFYASYVFPQSLATILIVVLVVLGGMASRDAIMWPATAAFVVVTIGLALTHHLTQILFVPVFVCITLLYSLHGRNYVSVVFQRRFVMLLGLFTLVNGAYLWQTGFFARINRAAEQIILGGLFGGYTRSVSLVFGTVERSNPIQLAAEWLFSLYGLYLMLLLAVFSIGVVWSVRSDWDPAIKAVALTGLLGALFIFDTPLSIKSLGRISSPWQFPFAVVLGIGIYQLQQTAGSIGKRRLLMGVLVVLAATTPVVTPDNYYEFDPRETTETSFTDQEFAELQATASFVEQRDEPTTAFWNTRLVLDRFRFGDVQHGVIQDQTLLIPAGDFIYRSAWADHSVSFTTESDGSLYSNRFSVSDRWLSDRIETKNKVYTAGDTGVTWSSTQQTFGTDESSSTF